MLRDERLQKVVAEIDAAPNAERVRQERDAGMMLPPQRGWVGCC